MKVTKLVFLFVAVFATISISSCSKDDEVKDDIASVSGNKYETTYHKRTETKDGKEILNKEFTTKEELLREDIYLILDFKSNKEVWKFRCNENGDECAWKLYATWTQTEEKIHVEYSEDPGYGNDYVIEGTMLIEEDSYTEEGIEYYDITSSSKVSE